MSITSTDAGRPTVMVVGAIPPPTHGVAVVVERILRSTTLAARFEIVHVDISDRRDLANIGRWDWTNVRLALGHWRRMVAALIRHRPAVVHLPLAQNYLGLFRDLTLLAAALAMPRTKVIGHVAGGGFGEFVRRSPPWFRRAASAAVSRCSLLIVSSEWHLQRVREVFPRARLMIVRRGTEAVNGSPRAQRAGATLRILFANSILTEDKGIFDALTAAALCEEQGIDATWTFIGSFVTQEDERRAMAAASDLESVEIVGPVDRPVLLERYLEADLFVFPPSPQEAFGLVRVEAMAAGLPIITTAAGGASEVIEDGREGFIVDYAEPGQIVEGVRRLIADDDLRERMSRMAQETQRRHFGMEAFEETLAAAWRSAIDG